MDGTLAQILASLQELSRQVLEYQQVLAAREARIAELEAQLPKRRRA